MEYIFPVASSLQQAEGNFDSPEVCRGIYQTLLELQSTGSVDISNLQGLFCSYICRCLSESPENVFPFEFALQKICNNEIFEQSLNYFGQVFKYAFTIDMIDNEDVFIDILSEVKDSKETTFCICLNGWLEKLDLSNTCNTFLPVLLTDVLEQIAFNEELDITNVKGIIKSTHPILRHLVSAVAISKQGVCSIHTLLSIAYIRKFLKLFVQILESVKFDCSEIIVLSQNVNAVLCQDESMGFSTLVSTEILHLFLKMLNSSSALGDIKIILEKIRNTITVMHNISNIWSDSTDEWPVFFPFYNHKNLDIYQPLLQEIINIGPTENKFKVVLESSDKSPLALLSILSRRFYMKLCLQERNYNEKRAAEELHLQINTSSIHMNIKNIAMRLLGIKEFKHNIFNLSEMVDEPIPQIVSVMIHLTGIITVSNASKNIWYRAMFSPKDVSADFTKLPQIFKLILNILLYSCYTASFALEFVSEKIMTTILPESKESVENILEQELKQNWINLQAMLKMNFNDMCVMLHELVYRSIYLFTSEAEIFTSEQFSEQLINQHIEVSKDIVTTRIEVIQTVKSGIPFNAETTIEKCVYDIEACKYDLDFQSAVLLFRLTSSPSKDVFLAEVQARHGEEFWFLTNVVDNMEKLELPQFILSFIKWHSAVVSCAKYKFRKVDFKDLTVLNFLQAFSEDEIRKNRLEEAFKHFSNDCNKLFTKFKKLLKEKGIDEEVITTMMHTKVKMPVCTILEEQSVMFKILKVLVSEQNRFINAAYSLSDQQNIIIREISVQDVRKSHLIKFEWDDYWLDYSQCDTRYGLGRKINFYFGNIERVLKQSLLVGKTLINIPSPLDKIIFTDDLFQNSIELMTEISNSIPQSRLSIEMKNSLQHKKERDVSQITELLNHTGMTLSLLRKTKTGIDPSRSLINYLKEWQHVTGMTSAAIKKLFPEDIRVGQVVDLYKWLEDINGENILETLEDRYRVVLVDSAKNSLLYTKANKMQYLEQLEHPLKVFIHRFLGVKDNDISLKQPLLEYISNKDLWWSDDFKDEQVFVKELPLSLHILLPPMILTENIHEVVEFVLNAAQESKQKESSKTLKSLYKTEPANEAPVQSKQAKAKKMMKF